MRVCTFLRQQVSGFRKDMQWLITKTCNLQPVTCNHNYRLASWVAGSPHYFRTFQSLTLLASTTSSMPGRMLPSRDFGHDAVGHMPVVTATGTGSLFSRIQTRPCFPNGFRGFGFLGPPGPGKQFGSAPIPPDGGVAGSTGTNRRATLGTRSPSVTWVDPRCRQWRSCRAGAADRNCPPRSRESHR